MIKLDADLIHGTSELFLKSQFDTPKPTPKFHLKMWEKCCSESRLVGLAAPRGHAKSTSVTHTYGIAAVLYRVCDFVLLLSDTEGQAVQFLGDIKMELQENEDLIKAYNIRRFLKDTESDIIVEFEDKEQFRIIAKGSEQKVRGLKWRGGRPNLILGDDLENDEIVMNPERREKFRHWFLNALLPCGADDCKVRIVGTILHLDSMLQRVLNNPMWDTLKFAAHGPNFTDILWPEKFSEARLREIRAVYENEGNLEGYSKEYLNNPVDGANTFFQRSHFIAMSEDDFLKPMVYVAAADFAISEKEKADYTVIMVAGIDSEGFVYILDIRRGRIGSIEIIDELIDVGRNYDPEIFTFETEKVDKAIGPFLEVEMRRTGVFLNIERITPTKSKTARGESIRKMMINRTVLFDKSAEWYGDLEAELMTVTREGPKGAHDDFFDAFAYIGLARHKYNVAPTREEVEEEEWYEDHRHQPLGLCDVTGY